MNKRISQAVQQNVSESVSQFIAAN